MTPSNLHGSLPRSNPEAQGISSRSLLALVDSLEGGDFQMHSLMLLRHGQVIAEGWWHPYDPSCKRYLYSLSKSFTSTAVGFAVQEGLLGVDAKVIDLLPQDLPQEVDANLAKMRVEDLLTMTSGNGRDTLEMIFQPGFDNWAQAILSAPVEFPPGTHFLYNTGATYLLSCIVQNVTGQTVLEYLTPRLFEPLGIHRMTWDTCPRGISTGGWGLSLETEALAKFGQFCLQKGCWEGKQLLSPGWIETATSGRVRNDQGEREKEPADWRQGYGYQFWRCQHNCYRGDGAYGQYCIVMPEQEAVMAITSETANMQLILDRVWEHLLPAMRLESLPPEPQALEELRSRLNSLQIPLPLAAGIPVEMESYSCKRFLLEDNPCGLKAVSVSFQEGISRLVFWEDGKEYSLVCSNTDWQVSEALLPLMQTNMIAMLMGLPPTSPHRIATHAQWTDPQTFTVTWQYLETPHSTSLVFRFLGDELDLQVRSSMADPNSPFFSMAEKKFKGILESIKVDELTI